MEAKLRLSSINRCDLLQYKRKEEDTDKLILVQIYENKFFKNNRIKKLVLKLWYKFTSTYPYFKNLWPKPPIIAYKNSRSIRNFITSSRHPPRWFKNTVDTTKFIALDELNLENLLALMDDTI